MRLMYHAKELLLSMHNNICIYYVYCQNGRGKLAYFRKDSDIIFHSQ